MLTHNKLIVARYKSQKCSHTFFSKHVGKAQAVESEDKQHCSADREQSGTAMCRFTGCKRFWPAMPSRPKFFNCSAGQGEYNPHALPWPARENWGTHHDWAHRFIHSSASAVSAAKQAFRDLAVEHVTTKSQNRLLPRRARSC